MSYKFKNLIYRNLSRDKDYQRGTINLNELLFYYFKMRSTSALILFILLRFYS